MKVLFTTAWYPNRKCAGDGVFIQKHAQAISLLNDVAVLMVQTDVAVHGWRIEMEVKESSEHLHELLVYVPKTRFEVPVLTGLLRLFWLMAGYLKGYYFIKKNWWQGVRPDVCHVNVLTRAAGLPWLLCKLHKIPYIITEHWSRYAHPKVYPSSRMQWFWGQRFVRDAAYVCPVSLNLEQNMKRWQLENRHYVRIGNVVDTDVFSYEGLRLSNPVLRMVHVSWMRDDSKNISGILRVLARLHEAALPFQMSFVGEGNDKEKLQSYAKELGLTDVITFLPALHGKALADTLRQHDVFVFFSHFENQPVSVLEALACGLPVISTQVGSVPLMLANQRGIVIEPDNESQLYEVLLSFVEVWSNRTEKQRQQDHLPAARYKYVSEHHSPDYIARQFDVLYQSAVPQSPS